MYAWIWRKLPFGLWGKVTGSLVLAVTIGSLLWYVVFPWATPLLPFDDVQVGTEQLDPNQVPAGTDLGPDEIPYPVHTNNPAPSAS
ncbi:hypothetical protein [Actinoplanes sp. NPDC051859]|uniref:hypothetical protein n=1 Tax=Actinoplanes sp. NPDC051859 TaxID=3363909 RepID=UPI0037AE9A37